MRVINDLVARCVREPTSTAPPRLELNRSNQSDTTAAVQLDGAILEQQYQLPDNTLLVFVTDDVPFEETLRIYLLTAGLKVLDGLEFGAAYAAADLADLGISAPWIIEFSFIHRKRCRLSVNPQAHWRMPLFWIPGVSRLNGFWRQCRLDLKLV